MKRRSKGDAGADGGFNGSGAAFGRPALIREAPDTWAGAEAQSWHARDGAVRIPNPFAKSEALPSRPFVVCDRRLASREPAADRVCVKALSESAAHVVNHHATDTSCS